MQSGTELAILSNLATILISGAVGIYLFSIWHHQESRLITDLPLVFAISFGSQALNMLLLALPTMGLVEPSMSLFRLRSIIIGGSTIPVLGALLQIWASSIQKYHNRLVLSFALYWILIALIGPTEAFIMLMTIPLMIVFGLFLMVTFMITWKTGRLTEIRSDLLIVSILFGIASQGLRVPLISTMLFYMPDVLLLIAMIFTAFAFTNPRSKKERGKELAYTSEDVIGQSVTY